MGSRVLAQRYELIEKIGEGGMAVVFKAYDRVLGRNVALKILRPEYTKDESFIDSFKRESQLIAGIVDPNIVQVYDVGQEGNIYYIVMELVEGETLSEIIKREERLDPQTVVSFGKQIAMALTTAHKNNLIHRDIKPHNIMVTYDGTAKLTDFGIAKRSNNGNTIVDDGKEAVMGSIHYFSPEQARGNKVDGRTDIYSLGIVMYEMLTGQVPYDGENAVEVAVKHMNEPMVPPSEIVGGVPQDLEDIILKATSKSADDRYANADEMLTDLNFVKFSRLADTYGEDESDDDIKIVEKKKFKISRSVLAAVLILAIPLLWCGIDAITSAVKEARRTVEVPELRGYTLEEAEKLLKDMELELVIASRVKSTDEFPNPDTITSTSPAAGSLVKPGQSIKANVTQPEPDPQIPNLYNVQLSVAKTKLEGLGFVIGEITEEYSPVVNEQFVISTKPAAGETLAKGSTIDLVVSKGEDPEGKTSFTIDVRGKSLEEAKKIIESAGCKVSEEINYTTSGDAAVDCVVSQYPEFDEEVEKETVFTLTVKVQEIQNAVSLAIDISGVTEENYTLSIIVEDLDGSTTQIEKTVYKKDGDTAQFTIHGRGTGKVYVTLDNDMITYSVDFTTGLVTKVE